MKNNLKCSIEPAECFSLYFVAKETASSKLSPFCCNVAMTRASKLYTPLSTITKGTLLDLMSSLRMPKHW